MMKSVSGTSDLPRQRRKALAASGVGTVVEFFDYASYSYLATIIAVVFFPPGDSAMALLQTFAVFALSFVMRPIGGLFWGHFGDRIGRKRTLVLTIMGMGMATLTLGVLPGYAAIGAWAPLLLVLLRLLQSFFTAGQYSGAALLAGEFAPASHRGRYVSVVPIGSAAGFLLASALASGLHTGLSYDEMLDWGWRVPFLLGGLLTLLGWVIRAKLEETPDFEAAKGAEKIAESPLSSLLRSHWRLVLSLLCIVSVNHAGYYIVLAYMATYLEVERGFSASQAGSITTIALIVYLPVVYLCAWMSDRVGRRPVLWASSILFLVASYPAFVILEDGGFMVALLVQLFLVIFLALNDSAFATLFVESFPVAIRFSGFALPFNVGAAVFGGASPLLAEWLIRTTGNGLMPALIMMAVAALSLPALLSVRETAPRRNGEAGFLQWLCGRLK